MSDHLIFLMFKCFFSNGFDVHRIVTKIISFVVLKSLLFLFILNNFIVSNDAFIEAKFKNIFYTTGTN